MSTYNALVAKAKEIDRQHSEDEDLFCKAREALQWMSSNLAGVGLYSDEQVKELLVALFAERLLSVAFAEVQPEGQEDIFTLSVGKSPNAKYNIFAWVVSGKVNIYFAKIAPAGNLRKAP